MLRKGLSIAFYFCAMALTTLFLAQMHWGGFPRMQVQYWPVCLALFFSLAVFLWPEMPSEHGGRRPYSTFGLRVIALLTTGCAPFVSWQVYLGNYGSSLLPGTHWIYFLSMSVMFLVCLGCLVAYYPLFIREEWRDQLLPGVGLLLGLGRVTIVIPVMAVLAAAGCLFFGDETGTLPLWSFPFDLWNLVTRGEGLRIAVSLLMMTFAAQAMGILDVLLFQGTKSSKAVPLKQDSPGTVDELIKLNNQEGSPDDKADETD